MNQILIPSKYQRHWKWPAVLNFFLGGAGAGYLLIALLWMVVDGGSGVYEENITAQFPAIAVIGIGMLALTTEAGRPFRAFHAYRNVARSWISREIFCFAALFCFCILDYLIPGPVFKTLIALSAAGLILSHGFILYRSKAIAAWSRPVVPIYFLVSGMLHGYGAMLLVQLWAGGKPDSGFTGFGIVLILAQLVFWGVYLHGTQSRRGANRMDSLPSKKKILPISIVTGNIIPILLMLTLAKGDFTFHTFRTVQLLCGIFILLGGLYTKIGVVQRTSAYKSVEI